MAEFGAPRCPKHPDSVVKILAADDDAVNLILRGEKLDGVCFYGCRLLVSFPSPMQPAQAQ